MVIEAWSRQGCVNEQVRHLDGNPSNNHVSNLKWGSVAENSEDTLRHERNRRAKLKSAQVLAIRRRASDGNGMELSRAYGVNISTILAVVRGKTWRHLPDARPDFAFFKGK